MTEDILKLIQKKYELKKEKKGYVLKLIKQIKELQKNESVRKYLDLIDKLESLDYIGILNSSDEDMMGSSFKNYMHLITETNEIYFCLGVYKLDEVNGFNCIPGDVRLNNDDPKAEYKIYINIENNMKFRIPIKETENFESTHKVIVSNQLQTNKVYDSIQTEFIKISVKEDQKTACEKVLNKKW